MTQRLYNDLSRLWPIVSPPEEYIPDGALFRDIIRSRLAPSRVTGGRRPRLLELGCGGGHLLSHLTPHFDAEAVDLSPPMLDLSRALNVTTPHHQGDMRSIRLGRLFDVVLIYDAVNYMLSETDLRAAIATAKAHLTHGGLLLLAPDHLTDSFSGPRVIDWNRHSPNEDVTFIEYVADPDPDDTTIESVVFFITNRAGRLEVQQDRHTFGLFPKATWIGLLEEAGFTTEYLATEGYEGDIGGHVFVGDLGDAAPGAAIDNRP